MAALTDSNGARPPGDAIASYFELDLGVAGERREDQPSTVESPERGPQRLSGTVPVSQP